MFIPIKYVGVTSCYRSTSGRCWSYFIQCYVIFIPVEGVGVMSCDLYASGRCGSNFT